MRRTPLLMKLESEQLKSDIPVFHVGDTISVHTRIIEGDKERIQVFTGTVMGRSGTGLSETVTLHRVAYGEGMERVFLIHSPRIAKIEVMQEGDVRRAKLYYLKGKSGKKARVKQRVVSRYAKAKKQAAVAQEAPAEVKVEAAKEDAANETSTTDAAAEEQSKD